MSGRENVGEFMEGWVLADIRLHFDIDAYLYRDSQENKLLCMTKIVRNITDLLHLRSALADNSIPNLTNIA